MTQNNNNDQRIHISSAREELEKEYEHSRQAANDLGYTPSKRFNEHTQAHHYNHGQVNNFAQQPHAGQAQQPHPHIRQPHAQTGQPYAQQTPHEQVQQPYAQQTPHEQVQQPYAQQTPHEQVQQPYAQQAYQQYAAHSRYAEPHRRKAHATQAGTNPYARDAYGTTGYKRASTQANNEASANGFTPMHISHPYQKRKNRGGKKVIIGLFAVIAICVVGVFAWQNYTYSMPVEVTINGEEKTIEGAQRSVEGLVDEGVVSVSPGDYVAVDEVPITEGAGTKCTAKVNDAEVSDLSTHLNEGDVIEISDGTNIMEEYTDSDAEELPYELEISGKGAVHEFITTGEVGEKVVRTGKESGRTVDVVSKEPVNAKLVYHNVDTKGDKVIALTFDDGPWESQTQEVLDVLEENGAKATFFTIGQQIANHSDVVEKAAAAGHEISTHTYDHAAGSGKGVSLNYMSTSERREEVTKGFDAINAVEGATASTNFRAPGGNFNSEVAWDLHDLVHSEIGWNIDTNDWRKPGADVIASRIENAQPGNIILMHDGGGDRSQTIEALKQALPKLKEEGYSFVTVSELLERYPYEESES